MFLSVDPFFTIFAQQIGYRKSLLALVMSLIQLMQLRSIQPASLNVSIIQVGIYI